jgi:hypothetical protein
MEENPMKITGQCHCGNVSYEANIDPDLISICHCTDCQTLTGSAYRVTAITSSESLRLVGSVPKIYTKIGQNGKKRFQYFCAECGSPLFPTGDGEDAGEWGIRWGSICQRQKLTPKRQMWCQSALPWALDLKDLPGTPTDENIATD